MEQLQNPVCKCNKCGSEFTIRPLVGQETVRSYGERLTTVICFKCGANASFLAVIKN